jgi:hypothetical protein
VLYRGDYEVSIRFTIMESKFRFKSGVNLVDSEKASYGQLAILSPYGGNVFSEMVKCEDGTVTFTLTKEMIDQLEEVGLYSFQIRLFDYYRESRVSIPPVEFGIEVREPVASEDHDNEVNNAIVGYSIAKVVDGLNENVPDTFDDEGQYNKTEWETGDRISEGRLNKIEDAIDKINQNEINDKNALNKQMTSNFNVLTSQLEYKADKSELEAERKRIDIFTSLHEGSTTGDAELIDGRIDNSGHVYKNIGSNIRTNFNKIDNTLDNDEKEIDIELEMQQGVLSKNNSIASIGVRACITVEIGYTYKISGYVYNETYPLALELDNEGNIINSINISGNDLVVNDYIYKPNNANVSTIVVNGHKKIEVKKVIKETIKETVSKIVNNKIDNNNKYLIRDAVNIDSTIDSGVLSKGGTLTNVGCHVELKVKKGETYHINGYVYSENYPLIIEKDVNGNIVGFKVNEYNDKVINDYIYTISENVYSITVNSSNEENLVIIREEIVNTKEYIDNQIEDTKEYIDNQIEDTKECIDKQIEKFNGKKIAWFGTSIPAGGYVGLDNANSYPMMIGEKLGAIVYNESIGSSCLCCRKENQVSSKNPYGFNGNFEQVSRCLTNTIEEMQWIIDNWNSDIWTSNKPLSKPAGDVAAQILDNSYENKLMRRLGEGRCDLYVIDHGHNEDFWVKGVDYINQPQDIYSKFSIQGCFNFIINLILNDNPKARILGVGEYEKQKNPQIKQLQEVYTEYWSIPLLPLYDLTGFSQRKVNTRYSWVNGKWTYDGNEKEMSILDIWIPDKIHPHSDKSGKCLEYLANIIGNWIEKNITL